MRVAIVKMFKCMAISVVASAVLEIGAASASDVPSAPPSGAPAIARAHRLTLAELRKDASSGHGSPIVVRRKGRVKVGLSLSEMSALQTLRQQKSVADADYAHLRLAPSFVVPRPAPSLGSTHVMSGGSTPSPTQQSQGSPAPPSINKVNVAPQAVVDACNINVTDPIIQSVSGAMYATFTQDQNYDLYTIKGCNFGLTGSNAKVWLYTNGLKLDFQVLSWSDTAIAVMLDPNLSGVPDRNHLTLDVQREDGKQALRPNMSFHAARVTVKLTTIPSSWVTPGGPSPDYFSPVNSGYGFPVQAVGATTYVSRWFSGLYKYGGHDLYDFSALPNGWRVDSYDWAQYDSGNCKGVVTYKGNFGSYGWQGVYEKDQGIGDPAFGETKFNFNWGDTMCSGWIVNPFPWVGWYSDSSASAYSVDVWVSGPRGFENELPH